MLVAFRGAYESGTSSSSLDAEWPVRFARPWNSHGITHTAGPIFIIESHREQTQLCNKVPGSLQDIPTFGFATLRHYGVYAFFRLSLSRRKGITGSVGSPFPTYLESHNSTPACFLMILLGRSLRIEHVQITSSRV